MKFVSFGMQLAAITVLIHKVSTKDNLTNGIRLLLFSTWQLPLGKFQLLDNKEWIEIEW